MASSQQAKKQALESASQRRSARERFRASTRRAERAEEASWAGLRPPSALTDALNRHGNSERGRIATREGYTATYRDTFRLTGQVCQMH